MTQSDLQSLLQKTQTTEREAQRSLNSASEEISALRASHSREIDELERQVQRKDRERRNMEDELREARDELSRERETVRGLKVSSVVSSGMTCIIGCTRWISSIEFDVQWIFLPLFILSLN